MPLSAGDRRQTEALPAHPFLRDGWALHPWGEPALDRIRIRRIRALRSLYRHVSRAAPQVADFDRGRAISRVGRGSVPENGHCVLWVRPTHDETLAIMRGGSIRRTWCAPAGALGRSTHPRIAHDTLEERRRYSPSSPPAGYRRFAGPQPGNMERAGIPRSQAAPENHYKNHYSASLASKC